MTPRFSVRTTPHYERLVRRLLKQHSELRILQERAVRILAADPYNQAGTHHIRKLVGVASGEGQWRLALSRFRFRYDVVGTDVVLHYCGLRREDTYD
jgi:hypothetical protein